jgi:hypothetical protein
MDKEKYYPIPGYEDSYEINLNGNVRSIDRYLGAKNGSIAFYKSENVKWFLSGTGYPRVHLYRKSKGKHLMIHRILAMIFIKNPDNKPCINHKNGIKTDFSLSNLEWCTHKENIVHAVETGLQPKITGEKHHMYGKKGKLHHSYGKPMMVGAKNHKSKLVLDTQSGIFYECVREAAQAKNIKKGVLAERLNGKLSNNTSLIYV